MYISFQNAAMKNRFLPVTVITPKRRQMLSVRQKEDEYCGANDAMRYGIIMDA